MTSPKSSISPRFYTFRTAFSSGFLFPLLNMLALTFLFPVANFLEMSAFRSASSGQGGPAATLKETYKYMLTDSSEARTIAILAVVACSVLLGVMTFRFISSKKTVNVFYSLGITRKSLFLSKYLAGFLMLVVSVAVPMALNLIVNLSLMGSSWQLWSATAYYFWSFSILACFSFTVTAAVFSCVGTVAEGCCFPFVILGAPTIILYCLQYLMGTLYGNPYGRYIMGESIDLTKNFKAFNPLLFLYDGLSNVSALDAEGKLVPSFYGESFAWIKPNFLPLVLWTIAIVAFMFLGMHLFQKRKAEICGFMGVNPVLNFLITFLLGFLGFGLTIHYVEAKLSMAIAILIGLLVFTVIYGIVDFALIRTWKEFLRGLKKLPIHLGIALVVGMIFATGLFGYSTHVPELSEIRRVAVTVPSDTFLGTGSNVTYSGTDYSWGSLGNMLNNITDTDDIDFVRRIHEEIVNDGNQDITANDKGIAREDQIAESTVQVVYELKNGKRFIRSYNKVPVKTVNQLLNLEDTKAGHESIRRLLTDSSALKTDGSDWYIDTIQTKGNISLISPLMDQETSLTLSDSQRKTLLSCIADDLTAQPAADRYFPKKPLIGMLQIQDVERGDYRAGENGTYRSPSLSVNAGYTVPLREGMVKTIQFLKANGFYDSIGQQARVESLEVMRAVESNDKFHGSSMDLVYDSFYFIGSWRSQKQFDQDQTNIKQYGDNGYATFKKAVKISDAKQAQEVVSLSHIAYFYGTDGYFVRAKLAGDTGYTCMFLPESAAPQYVKDAVK